MLGRPGEPSPQNGRERKTSNKAQQRRDCLEKNGFHRARLLGPCDTTTRQHEANHLAAALWPPSLLPRRLEMSGHPSTPSRIPVRGGGSSATPTLNLSGSSKSSPHERFSPWKRSVEDDLLETDDFSKAVRHLPISVWRDIYHQQLPPDRAALALRKIAGVTGKGALRRKRARLPKPEKKVVAFTEDKGSAKNRQGRGGGEAEGGSEKRRPFSPPFACLADEPASGGSRDRTGSGSNSGSGDRDKDRSWDPTEAELRRARSASSRPPSSSVVSVASSTTSIASVASHGSAASAASTASSSHSVTKASFVSTTRQRSHTAFSTPDGKEVETWGGRAAHSQGKAARVAVINASVPQAETAAAQGAPRVCVPRSNANAKANTIMSASAGVSATSDVGGSPDRAGSTPKSQQSPRSPPRPSSCGGGGRSSGSSGYGQDLTLIESKGEVEAKGVTDITIGARVRTSRGRVGTIRFVGPTAFAEGEWVGVELDEAAGSHDGVVQGQRYFTCASSLAGDGAAGGGVRGGRHGTFVRRADLGAMGKMHHADHAGEKHAAAGAEVAVKGEDEQRMSGALANIEPLFRAIHEVVTRRHIGTYDLFRSLDGDSNGTISKVEFMTGLDRLLDLKGRKESCHVRPAMALLYVEEKKKRGERHETLPTGRDTKERGCTKLYRHCRFIRTTGAHIVVGIVY